MQELFRVQKLIAQSGLMSRREAEKMISSGLVFVNGIKASLGDKAS
ncbi:S4 domain-containing protein, partial [Mycoplasmopsis bovis]